MVDYVWPQLPPDVEERIISFLPLNEVLCTFKLVSKAAAARCKAFPLSSVRLSMPVPRHAFVHRWVLGGTHGLSYTKRLQLLCLTAASGVMPNLVLAVGCAGCVPMHGVMEAAAGAGRLQACRWLRSQGCDWGQALAAAAGAGHRELCRWLLGSGCPCTMQAVLAAARGGNVGLMAWLLSLLPAPGGVPGPWTSGLAAAAAEGCDLPTLQQLVACWEADERRRSGERGRAAEIQPQGPQRHPQGPQLQQQEAGVEQPEQHDVEPGRLRGAAGGAAPPAAAPAQVPAPMMQQQSQPQPQPQPEHPGPLLRLSEAASSASTQQLLTAAASSRTADWRAKLQWLELLLLRGRDRPAGACLAAAGLPDAAERLAWLHGWGYPVAEDALEAAARAGNTAALAFLLDEAGVACGGGGGGGCCAEAAAGGHVAALEALDARGWPVFMAHVVHRALRGAHMHVCRWAERRAGGGQGLRDVVGEEFTEAQLFAAAARGGSVEALQWLWRLGFDWGRCCLFTAAAEGGSLEVLEWLVAQGAVRPSRGDPYVAAARRGDLATLRCLHRLGCTWDHPSLLETCVHDEAPLEAVRWLAQRGCPMPGRYFGIRADIGLYDTHNGLRGVHWLLAERERRRRRRTERRWGWLRALRAALLPCLSVRGNYRAETEIGWEVQAEVGDE